MSNLFRKYGTFLLVPGFVLGYSILIKLAAGPYWLLTNMDPTYIYLLDGLRLLKGLFPNVIEQPVTPLQMLFCAVCWLCNIGRSVPDIVTRVFLSPEIYLNIVFVILSLFYFFTTFSLAMYVFRKTGDRLAAVLTQLPALSILVLEYYANKVSPESLLICVVNLFNICLFKRYFAKTPKGEYTATLFWGFVCGLGVAVKLTFLPLLLIPLIVLSWRNRIIFVSVFMASFILWILPILPKYHIMGHWIKDFLTHTGAYGTGEAGVIEIHSYCLSWRNIIVGQWVFISFLIAALFLCLWKFAKKKWEWGSFYLLAIVLGVLFQFAVVAKQPAAHYLLPGIGLFSALLVLLYQQGPFHHRLGQRIIFVFILVFVLAGVWQGEEYRSNLASQTKEILAFYNHVHEKYKGFIFIGYYEASGLESALAFGDLYTGSWEELNRLYPNSFTLNMWSYHIMNYTDRVWSNDLLAQFPGVVFMGISFDFSPSPFSVRLLEKGRFESIYLLTGTTEKQAMMFHLASDHFFQTGDNEKGLAYQKQAEALHYLP